MPIHMTIEKMAFTLCVFASLFFSIGIPHAETRIGQPTPFSSSPEDRFTIGVPFGWQTRTAPSAKGRMYAFWDGTGNAVTVEVGAPNSFKELLTLIAEDRLSKAQLSELQQRTQRDAPLKLDLSLSIATISNRKAFGQTYFYRQESLGNVVYMRATTYDFLYDGKQYGISVSSAPVATREAAAKRFDAALQRYFRPMLLSLILN